jgi:hypothetical protein
MVARNASFSAVSGKALMTGSTGAESVQEKMRRISTAHRPCSPPLAVSIFWARLASSPSPPVIADRADQQNAPYRTRTHVGSDPKARAAAHLTINSSRPLIRAEKSSPPASYGAGSCAAACPPAQPHAHMPEFIGHSEQPRPKIYVS